MRLGYGSEFQLLRYLGHHRNYLNDAIRKEIGEGAIEWLDYPIDLNRDSRDGEICGIDCFKGLSDFEKIRDEWENTGHKQEIHITGMVYSFIMEYGILLKQKPIWRRRIRNVLLKVRKVLKQS